MRADIAVMALLGGAMASPCKQDRPSSNTPGSVISSSTALNLTAPGSATSKAVSSSPAASSSAASALAPSSSAYSGSRTPNRSWAPSGTTNSGKATYYSGNLSGGTCSFNGASLPSGMYGTAIASDNWAGSALCGVCISVTGPSGNSITAMVVDECPNCGMNHLDLFPDGFAALDSPSKGVIDVTWQQIPCTYTTPISIRNKDGTSQYWFSMQVINANHEVTDMQVSTDGGNTWTSTVRQNYDYFQKSDGSGFQTATTMVKVTCSNGNSVTVSNVGTTAGSSYTASGNC